MMTRELLLSEMARSEAEEEKIYKELTLALFRELQAPIKERYDQLMAATGQMTTINRAVLQANPQLIKILRYCLAPVISQMRLGQIIGVSTTDVFEEGRAIPNDAQADQLVHWFHDYLDRERFSWLDRSDMPDTERRIAAGFAKLWTVSLLSNQNTATKYRTQRKDRQEKAIADALERMGLRLQDVLGPMPPPTPPRRKPGDPPRTKALPRPGGIAAIEDVRPGHYVKEKKILGTSQKKQKSDLTARPARPSYQPFSALRPRRSGSSSTPRSD